MTSTLGQQPPSLLAIVPTLGERPGTLRLALSSIRSQHQPVRIVLVSPRSVAVDELADEFGAEVVEDPGRGLSAAMNVGLAQARDETAYLWLNDDDLLRPGGLAALAELLSVHPDASAAFGGCDYITPAGDLIGTNSMGRLASLVQPWGPNLVPMPATLTRVAAARAAGGYDEDLALAMDLDLFLRLRRIGPLVATREVVAAFRWHPDSLTVANRAASLAEAEAVRRRYLPAWLASLSGLWNPLIRFASTVSAQLVDRRARALSASS